MKHLFAIRRTFLGVLFSLLSVFGLSANTANVSIWGEWNFRAHKIIDFKGIPVESFVRDDRCLFSLDEFGVLRAYPFPAEGEWRDEIILFEGIKQASVGNDFLLVLNVSGQLFKYGFDIFENEDGSWHLAIEEHYKVLSEGVKQISAGFDHYLFVLENGTLMGGGHDAGDGRFRSSQERIVTQPILLASGVSQASAGYGNSLFIKNNGDLFGMGANGFGCLGVGHASPVYSPVKIVGNVRTAKAEIASSWFITEHGDLHCMGKSGDIQNLEPVFVASNAVDAAISYAQNNISWLNSTGELLSADLTQEGRVGYVFSSGDRGLSVVAMQAGYLNVKSGTPLLRYVYSDFGVSLEGGPFEGLAPHTTFMTISPTEADFVGQYLSGDGINHWVEQGPVNGAKPVFRLHNTVRKNHFYTISEAESALVAAHPSYQLDGVAYYAWDYPYPGTQPVYRFYSDITHSHLYILGDNHRDELLSNPTPLNFQYEGVAYYAWGFWNAD